LKVTVLVERKMRLWFYAGFPLLETLESALELMMGSN